MIVYTAINSAVRDAQAALEKKDFAKMHGILNSLRSAVGQWAPYNDGHFFNTTLVVDESIPGRLVFETHTSSLMPRALSRKYRTIVREIEGNIVATTMQTEGAPATPGERGFLMDEFEDVFEVTLSRTLEDDDVFDS